MKVDFYLPPGSLSDAPELARWAERIGFDGIFTAETSNDPFLPLLVGAEHTDGIELGTAIAVAFSRSPTELAHTAWDLAAFSGGRFLLGLGTQVRAHVTRRFSMPWDSPGPRLREYILALRAIWDTWQNGSPLRFEGEFYRLTLMTPFFAPGPIRHPDIPVYIAGVGPYMCRLAGELCQGFHVHPFHTVRYLDEVTLPRMEEGARRAGRSLDEVERVTTVFVVTGRNEEERAASLETVKQQIAFYASTPAYAGVLELHGWDFGPTLTALSKQGAWGEMARVVPDEAVEEVAVIAPLDELGARVRERYGDRVQRVGYYWTGPGFDEATWADLVSATKG